MKILKWIAIFALIIFLLGWIVVSILSEKKPVVTPTHEADVLAQTVMESLGKEMYDSIYFIKWDFPGGKTYLWNKKKNFAFIQWGEMKVAMRLDSIDGYAYKNGQLMAQDESRHCLQKAWEYWCNDSFWLLAPFKMNDPGTSRAIVEEVDLGEKGLMVEYNSGGVTPGDAFLWVLDHNNRPIGFKMWVKILPIKGIYATWENWQSFEPGFQLATHHKISFVDFDLDDIKVGNSYKDFGYETDPFSDLYQLN